MTDFDDDEVVAPLTISRTKRTLVMDRALTAAGLLLAGAAAIFPWYVFFNADKFQINVAEGEHPPGQPNWPTRDAFSVSPLALDKKREATVKPTDPLDALTTATATASISNTDKAPDGTPVPEDQPFPGQSNFRLLHVSNGRALIEDGSGMYVVRIGSILPDESKLATIEQRDGKWVIVTTKGEIVQ